MRLNESYTEVKPQDETLSPSYLLAFVSFVPAQGGVRSIVSDATLRAYYSYYHTSWSLPDIIEQLREELSSCGVRPSVA